MCLAAFVTGQNENIFCKDQVGLECFLPSLIIIPYRCYRAKYDYKSNVLVFVRIRLARSLYALHIHFYHIGPIKIVILPLTLLI